MTLGSVPINSCLSSFSCCIPAVIVFTLMTSRRKSKETCLCMLTTLLCAERSIYSMVIAFSRKILTLSDWTTTLMGFNISKYAILPITKKRNTSFFNHTILGYNAERVHDMSIMEFQFHMIIVGKAL